MFICRDIHRVLHESKINDQIYAVSIRGAVTNGCNAIASDPSLVFLYAK